MSFPDLPQEKKVFSSKEKVFSWNKKGDFVEKKNVVSSAAKKNVFSSISVSVGWFGGEKPRSKKFGLRFGPGYRAPCLLFTAWPDLGGFSEEISAKAVVARPVLEW